MGSEFALTGDMARLGRNAGIISKSEMNEASENDNTWVPPDRHPSTGLKQSIWLISKWLQRLQNICCRC